MTAQILDRLLVDGQLEDRLRNNGLITSPFLNPDEVETLRDTHSQFHPVRGRGFDTDFIYEHAGHKRALDEALTAVLQPAMSRLFLDAQIFNVTFVTKWPGEGDNSLAVHQDWSYVDESTHRCVTLWVPLDSTSQGAENGALGYLPRTHLLPLERRGANSLPWYLNVRDDLARRITFIESEAGNAAVFDCRILHGSEPNRTETPRRAVTAMLAVPEAELRYYHHTADQWESYKIDRSVFIEYGPFSLRSSRPRGSVLVETGVSGPHVVPAKEFLVLTGIDIACSEHPASNGQVIPMTGDPLPGPDPEIDRPLPTSPSMRRKFRKRSRRSRPGRDHASVATRFGTARSVGLRSSWSRLSSSTAWRLVVDSKAETEPLLPGGSVVMVVAGRSGGSPPGTAVVQQGSRIEALIPGTVISLSGNWPLRFWNFGPEPVQVDLFRHTEALTRRAAQFVTRGFRPSQESG